MSDPLMFAIMVVLAGAGAAIMTVQLRELAHRHALLDLPNERSSHTVPVPRVGGPAIATGMTLALLAFAAWPHAPAMPPGLAVVLLTSAAIGGIGLREDLASVPLGVRLAGHVGAAAIVTWIAGAGLAWWVLAASLVWMVGLVNAYNFMDGVDGIAGTQAVVAGAGWLFLGYVSGEPWLLAAGLATAAAAAGFLVYNWRPASIFMGDSGATALGFLFAALPLLVLHAQPQAAAVGAALVWPFVFDTSLTCLTRLVRGENILRPHRSHLYQRLVIAGWRHDHVALLYGALAAGGAALVSAFPATSWRGVSLGLVLLLTAGVGLWWLVRMVEHRAAGFYSAVRR